MHRATLALRLLLPAFLIGAIAAISFLEAPLKFQAPGITIPLGLGIGRLVFTALNIATGVVLAVLTLASLRPRAPRMPLVWLRERALPGDRRQRVLCSTIGAAVDLRCEDLRRLLVNAVYWCAGLEAEIPARAEVEPLRPYEPTMFGFGSFLRGLRPSHFAAR